MNLFQYARNHFALFNYQSAAVGEKDVKSSEYSSNQLPFEAFDVDCMPALQQTHTVQKYILPAVENFQAGPPPAASRLEPHQTNHRTTAWTRMRALSD